MNKIYLVCVEGSYLKAIENFEVSFTSELNQAEYLNLDDANQKANMLTMLGYNAEVIQYNFKEIDNPKEFSKSGLFVIKMNDGSYWTWDYYGNTRTSDSLCKDAILDSYKECQKRMKYQKIEGKAVQLQN